MRARLSILVALLLSQAAFGDMEPVPVLRWR